MMDEMLFVKLVVLLGKIVDLMVKFGVDGWLDWDVLMGEWMILCVGYILMG